MSAAAQPVETRRVKLKGKGGRVININASDFDPKLHTAVDEPDVEPESDAEAAAKAKAEAEAAAKAAKAASAPAKGGK